MIKSTKKMKNLIIVLISSLMFWGCNEDKYPADVEENYEELFPWQGIEKPESSYEDMNIRACNTEEALSDYIYFGKDITDKRTYTVTIECSYNESPPAFYVGLSKYEIRYIDEDKNIKSIGTKDNQEGISYILESGKTYTKTFEVQSGYPMYLFVNGGGYRFSSVKAKITAQSVDGLIVVPILSTEQYQNKMGFDLIPNPYCEYIILP